MEGRILKYDFALSPETTVLILFDGETPDEKCFSALKSLINLMETSLIEKKIQIQEPKKVRVRQSRRIELPPCGVHPESPRHPVTNRCVSCLREHGRHMAEVRKQRAS